MGASGLPLMCYDMERREAARCLIRYGTTRYRKIWVVATHYGFTDQKSEAPHGVTIDGVTNFTEARFTELTIYDINEIRSYELRHYDL